MIQTVYLNTAKLSKECREFYGMTENTHEAQVFIDTELYGMAFKGFSVCQNAIYFEELHNEALEAKERADKLLKASREEMRIRDEEILRDERAATIKSWNWPKKLENEFLEVFG